MKYNQILTAIVIVNATGIITGIAQFSSNNELSMPITQLQLLVIISPQYGNDNDILNSIQNYLLAVKNDLGWNGEIIILNNDNSYQEIDNIMILIFD